MDLFVPITVKARDRKKYTLVIVDEISRFTWVVFLRNKSHAADEIITLIKQSEVLYDHKVRQLHRNWIQKLLSKGTLVNLRNFSEFFYS